MLGRSTLRIDCPEERKFSVIKEIKNRLVGEDGVEVVDIDGVRVASKEGWWLIRASNTQAVLVARCESASESGLLFLKKQIRNQLTASAIEVPFDLI